MSDGTTIGAYRLIRPIGHGGMGVVHLAEHTVIGRRAAVKVLAAELAGKPDVVQRFLTEARAAAAVQDPGIVQIFDFGVDAGRAFMAMELLDGEPLRDRLRRVGRMAYADAARSARQLAASLAVAHARGVIHRDLKPDNVFLVADGEVIGGERTKILDFGIAKIAEGSMVMAHDTPRTMTGVLIGTPTYMSPEQCKGTGPADHRTDLYSLGCVLHEMLTGRPPFLSEGIGELLSMHIREPASPPSLLEPSVPPELDAIVLRLLAKSPDQRFATGTELVQALDAFTGRAAAAIAPAYPPMAGPMHAPVHTPMPHAGPAPTTMGGATGSMMATATRPPPARSRWIVPAVVGTLLIVGGAIAIGVTQGRKAAKVEEPAAAVLPIDAPAPPPIDAPAPPPIDAPAPPIDAPVADAAVDAGSIDAAPLDAAPIDAAPPIDAPKRSKPKRCPDPQDRPPCDGIPDF